MSKTNATCQIRSSISGMSLSLCTGLLFICVMSGCSDQLVYRSDKQIVQKCDDTLDCPDGYICIDTVGVGVCKDVDTVQCHGEQTPNLFLEPGTDIQFGEVTSGVTKTVSILNNGSCALTIHGIEQRENLQSAFACEVCASQTWNDASQMILPGQRFDFDVSFFGNGFNQAESSLRVYSDDTTLPDGIVDIRLSGRMRGAARFVLDVEELEFGTVGEGESRARTAVGCNEGEGDEPLQIERLSFSPPVAYGFRRVAKLGDSQDLDPATISPASPLRLEQGECVHMEVLFAPDEGQRDYPALLFVTWATDSQFLDSSVYLNGTTNDPPDIEVSETTLSMYSIIDQSLSVGVGQVAMNQFSVSNRGGSDLIVEMGWEDNPRSEFTVSPSAAFQGPMFIPAGQTLGFFVTYSPSEPSSERNPTNPNVLDLSDAARPTLRITANDPEQPLSTIDMTGFAKAFSNNTALMLEMTFDNDNNSWSNNDFRDVDLELHSPSGDYCRKPIALAWEQNSNGYWEANGIDAPCERWNVNTDQGITNLESGQGYVRWYSAGLYEEPERIVLYGLKAEQSMSQPFEVKATYVEDCQGISDGLASVLGISGSLVIQILGAVVGVNGLALPPDLLVQTIQGKCSARRSTSVKVKVKIDGQEVGTFTRILPKRNQMPDPTVTVGRFQWIDGAFILE